MPCGKSCKPQNEGGPIHGSLWNRLHALWLYRTGRHGWRRPAPAANMNATNNVTRSAERAIAAVEDFASGACILSSQMRGWRDTAEQVNRLTTEACVNSIRSAIFLSRPPSLRRLDANRCSHPAEVRHD